MLNLALEVTGSNSDDNYKFARMPKFLFNAELENLSSNAKTLYALLLDRESLSKNKKNLDKYTDSNNRVFIIFTRKNLCKALNLCHKTVCTLMKMLREHGLIDEIRQGLCKPNRIYINHEKLKEEVTSVVFKKSQDSLYDRKCNGYSSGDRYNNPQEMEKVNANYTNFKETNKNYTKTTTGEDFNDFNKDVVVEVEEEFAFTKSKDNVKSSGDERIIKQANIGQVKELQAKIEKVANERFSLTSLSAMTKRIGLEYIHIALDRFDDIRPANIESVYGFIEAAAKAEKYDGGYNSRVKAKTNYGFNKPSQSTNFSQREYSDEFFESLYDNFNGEIHS
jgi:hypothetical protein